MKRSVLLAVLLATAAPAQNSATIYGTISDAGGAVVPGAAVTVIHVDTGTSRKSTTDIAGGYVGNVNERVEVNMCKMTSSCRWGKTGAPILRSKWAT